MILCYGVGGFPVPVECLAASVVSTPLHAPSNPDLTIVNASRTTAMGEYFETQEEIGKSLS